MMSIIDVNRKMRNPAAQTSSGQLSIHDSIYECRYRDRQHRQIQI